MVLKGRDQHGKHKFLSKTLLFSFCYRDTGKEVSMKKFRLLNIAVVLLFLASCGGSGGGGDGGGDDATLLLPEVLSSSPAASATGVVTDTVITATFSEAMDASTITSSTFTLTINPPVSGTVSYNSVTNTASFTPDADLEEITLYTATITAGVSDLAGNTLASDFVWRFTTESSIGAAVQLPETGQVTCYDESGTQIICPGTGQDGDTLSGISWPIPRFADNGDGTVTDKLTGLTWLKNANCFGGKIWTLALSDANSLASGSCGLSDGSKAGDWRLPNINELESLVNTEEVITATWLVAQGFTNVEPVNYWSATTYIINTGGAWRANMGGGRIAAGTKDCAICNVWPVRAKTTPPAQLWKTGQTICYNELGNTVLCAGTGQDGEIQTGVAWPSPRFLDNQDGTVTDKLTGLVWTGDANAPDPAGCTSGKLMLWQDALSYVVCLNNNNYLGYNDWRLPNRKELHSLTDFSQSSPVLQSVHPFTNVQLNPNHYWSSSTSASSTGDAWYASMTSGYVRAEVKTTFNSVWAVRAGQ
jgi:hypothetical protein